MEIKRGDAAAVARELRETMAELQNLKRGLAVNGTTNNNSPTINVNAGGLGVWICALCCAVSVAFGITTQNQLNREIARKDAELMEVRDEGRRMQSFLQAIYVQAPHLKPKDKK